MKPLTNMDEPTTRALQWLESKIEYGPLKTICRAVLERNEQALQTVCDENFAGDYVDSQAHSQRCNRELASLGLSEAIRTGYAHSRGGTRNKSGFVLICDERRTILYVMKDFDKEMILLTGQERQQPQLAVHSIETIKFALVEMVEAQLSRC